MFTVRKVLSNITIDEAYEAILLLLEPSRGPTRKTRNVMKGMDEEMFVYNRKSVIRVPRGQSRSVHFHSKKNVGIAFEVEDQEGFVWTIQRLHGESIYEENYVINPKLWIATNLTTGEERKVVQKKVESTASSQIVESPNMDPQVSSGEEAPPASPSRKRPHEDLSPDEMLEFDFSISEDEWKVLLVDDLINSFPT